MSNPDAHWITTAPEARLASGPERSRFATRWPRVRACSTNSRSSACSAPARFGIVCSCATIWCRRRRRDQGMPARGAVAAGRGRAVTMRASTVGCAEGFARASNRFFGERSAGDFDHPALIKVHRFWRGTAPPTWPCPTTWAGLEGRALQMLTVPASRGWPGWWSPLLGALEVLIARASSTATSPPDSILILPDGRPVLLDFGGAPAASTAARDALTAHLKPQFAPLEQYAEDDEPAAGALDRPVLARRDALLRRSADAPPWPRSCRRSTTPACPSTAPRGVAARPFAALLGTIDSTLALSPHDRPRDVAALRRALRGGGAAPPSPRFPPPTHPRPPSHLPRQRTPAEHGAPSKGEPVTPAAGAPSTRPAAWRSAAACVRRPRHCRLRHLRLERRCAADYERCAARGRRCAAAMRGEGGARCCGNVGSAARPVPAFAPAAVLFLCQ